MRSLTAKNPFLSAHDSLVGLFGETSLKVCVWGCEGEEGRVRVRVREDGQ